MSALIRSEPTSAAIEVSQGISRDQVELIKRTIAKGATDDELKLFVATSQRLKLDPFARQIFAIKRWDPDTKDMGMTTHVSIDGLRLIAERTEAYLPAEELPEFRYNAKGDLTACVVHVQKLRIGVWHKVPAIAFFDEYAGHKRDGGLTKNWLEKPHIMLAKCAEALAIRKAFPNETSGVYVPEEFATDVEPETITPPPRPTPPATTQSSAVPPPPKRPAGPGPAVQARQAQSAANDREVAKNRPDAGGSGGDNDALSAPSHGAPPPAAPLASGSTDAENPANYHGPGSVVFGQGEPPPKAADLPPENPTVDADGLVRVDQIIAALSMAGDLAQYRVQRHAMEVVRNDERNWLAPHLVTCLLRLLAEGQDAELDGVMSQLGKFRTGNWISAEQLERAKAVYAERKT